MVLGILITTPMSSRRAVVVNRQVLSQIPSFSFLRSLYLFSWVFVSMCVSVCLWSRVLVVVRVIHEYGCQRKTCLPFVWWSTALMSDVTTEELWNILILSKVGSIKRFHSSNVESPLVCWYDKASLIQNPIKTDRSLRTTKENYSCLLIHARS